MRAHPAGKLGEGATAVTGAELCERLFQSTPPARGATFTSDHTENKRKNISIHAPREGGDVTVAGVCLDGTDFNPRPREGGDLVLGWLWGGI